MVGYFNRSFAPWLQGVGQQQETVTAGGLCSLCVSRRRVVCACAWLGCDCMCVCVGGGGGGGSAQQGLAAVHVRVLGVGINQAATHIVPRPPDDRLMPYKACRARVGCVRLCRMSKHASY